MTAHIDEDFAPRIQQFVETGGTVVATYFTAVFDRWQRLETGGYPAGRLGLSDLFGIEVTERDQLPAGRSVDIAWDDGAEPVTTGYHYCEIVKANPGSRVRVHARYDGEFYRGTPVVTEHVLPSNSGGGDDAVDAGSAWYLAAWCHLRAGLRAFALERMDEARAVQTPAHDVDAAELATLLDSSYGIFSGPAIHTAELVFSPMAARWVAEETWHPAQQGAWLADGRYRLQVPYAEPTELVMDVMRHGAEVEVVAPAALRQRVSQRLLAATEQYKTNRNAGDKP